MQYYVDFLEESGTLVFVGVKHIATEHWPTLEPSRPHSPYNLLSKLGTQGQ